MIDAAIKAEIEARIGGAYHLPDGRKFWIDTATVREIINRIAPAIVTAIDQSQADLVAALKQLLDVLPDDPKHPDLRRAVEKARSKCEEAERW